MSATPDRRSMLSQSHPPSAQPRRSTTHPSEAPSLPEYVAPEAPLTAEAQRHLAALISNHHHRNLITHLKHAAEKLTHSGGEVNERLADARGRYEKNKYQRRQREGIDAGDENDEDDEEYQRLAEDETRVNAITARMEEKARLIVDSEAKLQGLTDAVTELERQEGEAITAALGSRQTRAGQRTRRRGNDEDEDGDGEDENDADYEDAQERETQERNARNPPSRRLEDKLAEDSEKWNEMSLTERYAGHNNYIGFYRMVHDSKFPGDDVPPLPHSSTWFQHMEDTSARSGASTRTRNQRRRPSAADDDDIAIERERISLKCPLTLLPFRDPVTSTKCPHSFEREPIFDMINRSTTTIPPPAARRGQRRIHVVKCPVCSTPLTADDLNPDPVLLRRVRRAQELEEREEDEDHLEDGRKNKRRNTEISLASDATHDDDDDAMDVDADEPSQRIKAERLSQPAPMSVDGSESGDEEQSGEDSEEREESED